METTASFTLIKQEIAASYRLNDLVAIFIVVMSVLNDLKSIAY